MQPDQDWMLIQKPEQKSPIIKPEGYKESTNMVPFRILAIGPGRHEFGTFIKTTHKPGEMVFISGGVIEAKYQDIPHYFAKERDIVAHLI